MNQVMTKDQGTSIIERILYGIALAVAMKAVAYGWIEADMAPYYAAGLVTLVASAYAWWINRPVAIAKAAENISPDTKVITTPAIAAATPDNPNILSSADVKVVQK